MILNGSQRCGARALARHLLNTRENDHVELHAIHGCTAQTLTGALTEMQAISRATKCTQFMFSLSLSPPADQTVTTQDFEDAIDLAADRLGLQNQPRVVVFHTKKARTHCHVVFSRINTEHMKAINLPFYKERLREVSRELYLSHGWDMPKGLQDRALKDPLNYSLEEYQLALRAKRDPREIKSVLQRCWQQSDTQQSFASAMQENGFYLCQGDRRGFVALDWQGNVYSLTRWLDEPSKSLKSRLGDPASLPTIEQTSTQIAHMHHTKGQAFERAIDAERARHMQPLEAQRRAVVMRQRKDWRAQNAQQKERHAEESRVRAARFRKGVKGLWDFVTGKTKAIRCQNQAEYDAAITRDARERDALRQNFRREMKPYHERMKRISTTHTRKTQQLKEVRQAFQSFAMVHHEKPKTRGFER